MSAILLCDCSGCWKALTITGCLNASFICTDNSVFTESFGYVCVIVRKYLQDYHSNVYSLFWWLQRIMQFGPLPVSRYLADLNYNIIIITKINWMNSIVCSSRLSLLKNVLINLFNLFPVLLAASSVSRPWPLKTHSDSHRSFLLFICGFFLFPQIKSLNFFISASSPLRITDLGYLHPK